jgi:hypothetical protein
MKLAFIKSTVFTLVLFSLLFFVFVSPVKAQKNCAKPPDHPLGYITYLFNNYQQDCSWEPLEGLDNSIVTCIDDPGLTPSFSQSDVDKALANGELYDQVQSNDGTVSTALESIPNYSQDTTRIAECNGQDCQLYTNQAINTSYAQEHNPNLFEAMCEGMPGSPDRISCAQSMPGATIPTSDGKTNINHMAIGNREALIKSPEQRVNDIIKEKQFSDACLSDPNSSPDCYNVYNVNPSALNTDISTPESGKVAIKTLTPEQMQKLSASGQPKKDLEASYVCVSRNVNLGVLGDVFNYFGGFFNLNTDDTACQEIPTPGITALYEQVIERFLSHNGVRTNPETGETELIGAKEVEKAHEFCRSLNSGSPIPLPPAKDPSYQPVVNKISKVGGACIKTDNTKDQFNAGHVPVDSQPATWNFNLPSVDVDAILAKASLYAYSAWLVQPLETCVVQQLTAIQETGYTRNYFTPQASSTFSEPIHAPYSPGNPPAAQANTDPIGYYIEEVTRTDPETGETYTEEVRVDVDNSYSSSGNTLAKWYAGWPAQYENIVHQSFYKINDPQRFDLACLYPNLIGHDPSLVNKLELNSSLLGAYTDDSSCQTQPLTGAPEISGDINCNQNVPEQSVSGLIKSEGSRLASIWYDASFGGQDYFDECNNDAIQTARAGGMDPIFALAVWIHESGASNYIAGRSRAGVPVEDFGIHTAPGVGPEDFRAQADYFVKLNYSGCPKNLTSWISMYYFGNSCTPTGTELVGVNQYISELQFIYNVMAPGVSLPTWPSN